MFLWGLAGITILTYGVNFALYRYLKQRPEADIVEKLSICLGVNMSVFLADGLFLFVAKLVEESLLVIE